MTTAARVNSIYSIVIQLPASTFGFWSLIQRGPHFMGISWEQLIILPLMRYQSRRMETKTHLSVPLDSHKDIRTFSGGQAKIIYVAVLWRVYPPHCLSLRLYVGLIIAGCILCTGMERSVDTMACYITEASVLLSNPIGCDLQSHTMLLGIAPPIHYSLVTPSDKIFRSGM